MHGGVTGSSVQQSTPSSASTPAEYDRSTACSACTPAEYDRSMACSACTPVECASLCPCSGGVRHSLWLHSSGIRQPLPTLRQCLAGHDVIGTLTTYIVGWCPHALLLLCPPCSFSPSPASNPIPSPSYLSAHNVTVSNYLPSPPPSPPPSILFLQDEPQYTRHCLNCSQQLLWCRWMVRDDDLGRWYTWVSCHIQFDSTLTM